MRVHCMSQPPGSVQRRLSALFALVRRLPGRPRRPGSASRGGMGLLARHTAATESHQPGKHVDGDVIAAEDRVRTRVSPIQPVTASRGRGRGRGIFVIKRASASPDNRPRRHVSFAPVSRLQGSSSWHDKQLLETATPTQRGERACTAGSQHAGEVGRGSRMFGLVWTSCRKKPLRLPGRAEHRGACVCVCWGALQS